jgi:hypothetical protein
VTVTFIYLMVVLKIPIIGLLALVWWAIKQTPEPSESDGGNGNMRATPRHPRPPRPRHPRRGCPHGVPPSAPPRVRSVTARGREMAGSHS